MSIQLPSLFEEKLRGHSREAGIVHAATAKFGDWFKSSGRPLFFPDYTDHGTEHISNVLATAAQMMPPVSQSLFTAADATVFVLATLLHDSALHLEKPGFQQLIHGDARDQRIDAFDSVGWTTLWDEFLFSARRWDDRKLIGVFGEQFLDERMAVQNPFDHWDNLSETDHKLIGEFIRHHHPRLAHEFGVFGVPGVAVPFLQLPAEVTSEWKDLVGVIARSHGVPLRSCSDYVEERYHRRDYQSIHAVYLMALLRLADYLQIDASRAPDVVFGYRVLPSKTSQLEWRAHAARLSLF